MPDQLNFNEWWNKLIREWAFPSTILSDKHLMGFLKMVAKDAYITGYRTSGKKET